MQYFLGIVPPDSYLERIQLVQGRSQTMGVEPHITVKAQGGLTPDLEWVNAVAMVCRESQPFEVTLGAPQRFGERVLFLSVESSGLLQLHRRLVEAVRPGPELVQRYFELEAYVPHLTLGIASDKVAYSDLEAMKRRAEQELAPWPTFAAEFVRIYRQGEERQPYQRWRDIPLGRA